MKKFFERQVWLSIFISLTAIVLTTLGAERDTDLPWHIRMGMDVLEGKKALVDHHSISHYGESVKYTYLLFQITVGAFYTYFGYLGIIALKFLLGVGGGLSILKVSRKWNVDLAFAALGLSFFAFCFTGRFSLRADNILYILLPWQMFWLDSLKRNWSLRVFFYYTTSLVFWVNWQSASSSIAYVFLGLTIAEIFFVSRKLPYQLLLTFLLSGFIQPLSSHPLHIGTLDSNKWANYATEMAKTDLSQYTILSSVFGVFVFCFAMSIRQGIRQQLFSHLGIITILIYYAFQVARMVLTSLAASAVPLSRLMSFAFEGRPQWRMCVLILSTVISTLSFQNAINILKIPFAFQDFSIADSGRLVFEQIKNPSSIKGNILTDPNIGGYVMLNLPEARVSLDTRSNILHSISDFEEFADIKSDRNKYDQFLTDKTIEHQMGRFTIDRSSFFRWVAERTDFYPLAFDDIFFLWSKIGAKSLRSSFWNPACLEKLSLEAIRRDQTLLKETLTDDSITMKTIQYISNTLESGLSEDITPPSDLAKRFAARILIQKERYSDAEIVYSNIVRPLTNDLLDRANLLVRLDRATEAHQLLQLARAYESWSPVENRVLEESRNRLSSDPEISQWLDSLASYYKRFDCN